MLRAKLALMGVIIDTPQHWLSAFKYVLNILLSTESNLLEGFTNVQNEAAMFSEASEEGKGPNALELSLMFDQLTKMSASQSLVE
jgi:hypothetical protein